LYPNMSYLELFARRKRLGWASWGNEVSCDVDITASNSSSSGIVGTGAKKSTQLSMALSKETSQPTPQSAEH